MGGVEIHVSQLAEQLVSLGHRVVVYTLSNVTGESTRNGVVVKSSREYLRVGGVLGFPGWGMRRALSRDLKSRAVDVVSIHTRFFPMSWVGLRAGSRVNIPVILTEHGSNYVVSPSRFVSMMSRCVDWTLGKTVMKRADELLAVSPAVAKFTQRLSGRKGTVFFNAVGPSTHHGTFEARRGHLVFVGRLVFGKGWEIFLDLVTALSRENVNISAAILGDGPDNELLRQQIEKRGLGNLVDFRGRVSPTEVRAELRGATLINPTVLAEGFQTTLLEALVEHAQVVTFDVPGAEELVSQGAPVHIAVPATFNALLAATRGALESPESPMQEDAMKAWLWDQRADEFIHVCEKVLERRRAE